MKTKRHKRPLRLRFVSVAVLAVLITATAIVLIAGTGALACATGQIRILKVDDAGNVINLPGAKFNIHPTIYYGSEDLVVEDNDPNDHDLAYGVILLQGVLSNPGGSPYTITEIAAPEGYEIDPTPQTQIVDFDLYPTYTYTFTFVNKPVGHEGYTPGYWKKWTKFWDGVGTDDVTTTIQTTDYFNATFGFAPGAGEARTGLADTKTLLEALSVSGGDLMALNRHAAAALVNADSGIAYPYTLAQVISIYRDAVGISPDPGQWEIATAKRAFETANQVGGPGF